MKRLRMSATTVVGRWVFFIKNDGIQHQFYRISGLASSHGGLRGRRRLDPGLRLLREEL
jgi:hypothetical protein